MTNSSSTSRPAAALAGGFPWLPRFPNLDRVKRFGSESHKV
jgi:hypothetical protein